MKGGAALSVLCVIAAGSAAAQLPENSGGAPGQLSLHVGRVTLIPGGFFETIGVVRSATTSDNVATNFAAIPLTPTPIDGLGSIRHSRLMLHAESRLASGAIIGYVETDFLNSPGQTPWRLRQAWGAYTQGAWQVLAGQAWSLLRANQTGINTERDLVDIDVIDPAYHVGLLGNRRRQVRLVRRSTTWSAAVAFEERDLVAKVVRDRRHLHLEGVGLVGNRGRRGLAAVAVLKPNERWNVLTQLYVTDRAGKEAVGGEPESRRSYAAIQGIEARPRGGLSVFAYGGFVYASRSHGNRLVREWTLGVRQRIYKTQRHGSLTLGAHYSDVNRAVWSGREGELQYFMLSLRYTLPAEN